MCWYHRSQAARAARQANHGFMEVSPQQAKANQQAADQCKKVLSDIKRLSFPKLPFSFSSSTDRKPSGPAANVLKVQATYISRRKDDRFKGHALIVVSVGEKGNADIAVGHVGADGTVKFCSLAELATMAHKNAGDMISTPPFLEMLQKLPSMVPEMMNVVERPTTGPDRKILSEEFRTGVGMKAGANTKPDSDGNKHAACCSPGGYIQIVANQRYQHLADEVNGQRDKLCQRSMQSGLFGSRDGFCTVLVDLPRMPFSTRNLAQSQGN